MDPLLPQYPLVRSERKTGRLECRDESLDGGGQPVYGRPRYDSLLVVDGDVNGRRVKSLQHCTPGVRQRADAMCRGSVARIVFFTATQSEAESVLSLL